MRMTARGVSALVGVALIAALAFGISTKIFAAEIDTAALTSLLDTTSAAVIVTHVESNQIVVSKGDGVVRSIASLTKLMTAIVVLESNTPLDTIMTVLRTDTARASTTYLRIGDRVSVDTLLHLMVVGSDNAAARVLSRAIGITTREFVRRMNIRAASMGLTQTRYTEPSGLSAANHSTAADINTLMLHIIDMEGAGALFNIPLYQTKIGRRTVVVGNTNRLFRQDIDILASKTGYTGVAKYCVTMMVEVPNGEHYIITILGARTSQERWTVAESVYRGLAREDESDWRGDASVEDCGLRPVSISDQGKAFIRQHERLTLQPYYDTNGYAVGYGMHTWQGAPVTRRYPSSVTESDVEEEFDAQLNIFAITVLNAVCAPLTQPMFDALVSVAWNVGRVNTSIVHKVDLGRPVVASDFLTTATSRRRRNPTLVVRRLREYLMFTGNYEQALNHLNSSRELRQYVRGTSVMLFQQ